MYSDALFKECIRQSVVGQLPVSQLLGALPPNKIIVFAAGALLRTPLGERIAPSWIWGKEMEEEKEEKEDRKEETFSESNLWLRPWD